MNKKDDFLKDITHGVIRDLKKWILSTFDNPYCLWLTALMFLICAGLNLIISVVAVFRITYTVMMVFGFAVHVSVYWARENKAKDIDES
jgi:hypothetical protein